MTEIWKKLNLKDQSQIVVIDAPNEFKEELYLLSDVKIVRDISSVSKLSFFLAFVTRREQIDQLTLQMTKKAEGDTVIWFAYPKGSSNRYKCDFNRDTGRESLGKAGFEGVRQVAIDEDWSAIRFRKVEYIKSMQRDKKRAMTDVGKKRAGED